MAVTKSSFDCCLLSQSDTAYIRVDIPYLVVVEVVNNDY